MVSKITSYSQLVELGRGGFNIHGDKIICGSKKYQLPKNIDEYFEIKKIYDDHVKDVKKVSPKSSSCGSECGLSDSSEEELDAAEVALDKIFKVPDPRERATALQFFRDAFAGFSSREERNPQELITSGNFEADYQRTSSFVRRDPFLGVVDSETLVPSLRDYGVEVDSSVRQSRLKVATALIRSLLLETDGDVEPILQSAVSQATGNYLFLEVKTHFLIYSMTHTEDPKKMLKLTSKEVENPVVLELEKDNQGKILSIKISYEDTLDLIQEIATTEGNQERCMFENAVAGRISYKITRDEEGWSVSHVEKKILLDMPKETLCEKIVSIFKAYSK